MCVFSNIVNVTFSRLILLSAAHFSMVAHTCELFKEEGRSTKPVWQNQ